METLQQNIINLNETIDGLNNSINSLEKQVDDQKKVAQQAAEDNDEKIKFNKAVEQIKELKTDKICSVAVDQQKVQRLLDALNDLQQHINSVNISAEEQQNKLNDLETKLANDKNKLNESKELKQSYQVQLRIQLKRKEEELAALRLLLDDNANNH